VFRVLQTFGKNYATGTETALTLTITGITAGSLIVVGAKWENQTTGEMTVQDITNSKALTVSTPSRSGDSASTVSQFAYYIAPSSGSIDITVTMPATATGGFIRFGVMEIASTSYWEVDAAKGANGTSAAPSTGNITTTGEADEIVVGFYGENNSGTLSKNLINGSNPDGILLINTAAEAQIWWKIFYAPITGASSATISVSQQWAMSAISFKAFPPRYGSVNTKKRTQKLRLMKAGLL
jgi:hypothetical protein